MTALERDRACTATIVLLEEAMSKLAPLAESETELTRCVNTLDNIISELNEYDYTH